MSTPAISKPVLHFFRRIVRGYFRRHFHAVRVRGSQTFLDAGRATDPLLIYANHGSWWDPMVAFLLAEKLMGQRSHYAPMDAQALQRYSILKRLGIFPIELETARGAVQFLRTGEEIVSQGGVLWVTPQGRFVDPRVRPVAFKPGLAALAARIAQRRGRCLVMPLAIEYPFWDERLPECLLGFGEPVVVVAGEDAASVQRRLIDALQAAMDDLQQRATQRDPAAFDELLGGTLGMGGWYGLGQRLKAKLLRKPYQPEHTALTHAMQKGSKKNA